MSESEFSMLSSLNLSKSFLTKVDPNDNDNDDIGRKEEEETKAFDDEIEFSKKLLFNKEDRNILDGMNGNFNKGSKKRELRKNTNNNNKNNNNYNVNVIVSSNQPAIDINFDEDPFKPSVEIRRSEMGKKKREEGPMFNFGEREIKEEPLTPIREKVSSNETTQLNIELSPQKNNKEDKEDDYYELLQRIIAYVEGKDNEGLEGVNSKTKDLIKDLKQRVERSYREREEERQKGLEFQLEISKLKGKEKEIINETERLKRDLEKFKDDNLRDKERIRELENSKKKIKEENELLREEVKEKGVKVKETEIFSENFEKLEKEKKELKKEIEKLRRNLREIEEEKRKVELDLEKSDNLNIELKGEKLKLEDEITEIKEKAEESDMKKSKMFLEGEMGLKGEIEELEKKNLKLEREIERIKEEISNSNSKEREREVEEMGEEIENLETKINHLVNYSF